MCTTHIIILHFAVPETQMCAHTLKRTHSHSHSQLYAGSGVEERNVKHLLAQPQRDPTAGRHRSPQPDSKELGYLCAHTRTHTHTNMHGGVVFGSRCEMLSGQGVRSTQEGRQTG